MSVGKLQTVNQCCDDLQIGRTKMYELMNSGEIKFLRIGSVRRIPKEEIDRYKNAQLAAV